MSGDVLLEVRDLRVEINEHGRVFTPVEGVSFELRAGECLGLVGESGCGKSLTLRSLMGLLPQGARVAGGTLRFRHGGALADYDPARVRGHGIAMAFQEPMTALNPLMRVGDLIADAHAATHAGSRKQARARAEDLMHEVGIPDPARRRRAYPHQLSGGLRQRVMIAMTLASEPKVLVCDEPTTALDVTVQEQILLLLERIRRQRDLAIVYVTHDLAVVSQICDHVAVMYAGRIVESGSRDAVLHDPAHGYTLGLVRSVPQFRARGQGRLESIGGTPPDPRRFPGGCRFHPRCAFATEACGGPAPVLRTIEAGHETACLRAEAVVEANRAAKPAGERP